jgi:16S rRNA (guanine966-N2)-methyltransferase
MRIIAGRFKSRIISNPKSGRTHPMSEKIRGALFNSIGDISDKSFLDAFAGSGAVAIEALSRGAGPVHAVEVLPDTFDTLKENRDLVTDDEELQVHRANVRSWLKTTEMMFDIIVADPPYDAIGMNAIDTCAEHVKRDGLFIVSMPQSEKPEFKHCKLLGEKYYGNAKLLFYRKMK